MAKWRRVGGAFEFRRTPDAADIDLGWSWRVERDDFDRRYVRVEIARGGMTALDLPRESREAIRTHGASVVDSVLDEDDPPLRLVVSTLGVRAR
jgi:hypothetical protein